MRELPLHKHLVLGVMAKVLHPVDCSHLGLDPCAQQRDIVRHSGGKGQGTLGTASIEGQGTASITPKTGSSRTSTFALPQVVADLVRQGVELGKADDQVFGRENSGRGDGTVGHCEFDPVRVCALTMPLTLGFRF